MVPHLSNYTTEGLKILQAMQDLNYVIQDYNIVYVEGIDTDLSTINADRLDVWNDVRCVVGRDGKIYLAAQATTEPGRYYTNNPLNSNGAARLAFGQYLDCWTIGDHRGQDALVQCDNLTVCRDFNKDGSRTGDKKFVGSDYGINQHTTSNGPELIGKWSAGCLVGRHPTTHRLFMRIVRDILSHSGRDTVHTTLLDGSLL